MSIGHHVRWWLCPRCLTRELRLWLRDQHKERHRKRVAKRIERLWERDGR